MTIKQHIKRAYYNILYIRKNVFIRNGATIGNFSTRFEGNNRIGYGSIFKGYMGKGSYIGENCNIFASIGKYCSIASNVCTAIGKHPSTEWVTTHPAFFSTAKQAGFTFVDSDKFDEENFSEYPVVIENDVWIGFGSTLLQGITIGNGAIVAAGSVVVHDVEPYTIVAGVPAKVIRKRFSDENILYLLNTEWWNSEDKFLLENAQAFESLDQFRDVFGGNDVE